MRKKEFFRLTPFKMQVLQSFPFIDADFDALTNYELLCKVVEYLNITVDNVNLLNDDFKTLYDYVHDYFDNLDVQEEINNKLDDMAESGELAEIIAQYLSLAGVLAYDTVSDMKLADNLINGSIAKTLGYHTLNDGGGATYKIRTITNDDVVDEKFIIELADDTLIAELIVTNTTNILNLGAKANDNTFDNSTIINYILNKETYYNKVIIPNGIFYTTNPIIFEKSSSILKCDGIIKYTGNDSAIKIKTNKNVLDIYRIESNAKAITIENTDATIYDNNIKVNKIYSNSYNLYLHGVKPIYQINYECMETNTNSATPQKENVYMYIESSISSSFINEINFINCNFNTLNNAYAIKAVNESSTSEMQYNVRGGSMENTTGVYSEGKVTVVSFDYVRLHEFHNRTFLKIKGAVGRYNFSNCIPFHNTFIDWSEADESYGRIYCNSGYTDNVTGYTHVGECVFSNRCVLPQHIHTKYKTITADTTIDNVYTYGLTNVFEISTQGNTRTLTLDGRVYSGACINEVRMFVYGQGGSCVIKNQNDETMATLPYGRYLLLFGGTYSNPTLEYIIPDKRNT